MRNLIEEHIVDHELKERIISWLSVPTLQEVVVASNTMMELYRLTSSTNVPL
jgi:hypothetical protein